MSNVDPWSHRNISAGLIVTIVGGILLWFVLRALPSESPTAILVLITPTPLSGGKFQSPITQTSNSNSAVTPTSKSPNYSFGVYYNIDKVRASPGEQLSLELTAVNNGSALLTNLNVYVWPQPLYTTYISGSTFIEEHFGAKKKIKVADDWFADSSGTNLGSLRPGETLSLKWSVYINKDAPVGQLIEYIVGIQPAELDGQAYIQTCKVSATHSQSSLYVETSFDRASVTPGEITTYTISIRNSGDTDQTNVLVFDHLPDTLIYKPGSSSFILRASGSLPDWVGRLGVSDGPGVNLGFLKAGEQATIRFQATLSNNVKNGQIVENWGQVKSDQMSDWIQKNAVFTVKTH